MDWSIFSEKHRGWSIVSKEDEGRACVVCSASILEGEKVYYRMGGIVHGKCYLEKLVSFIREEVKGK